MEVGISSGLLRRIVTLAQADPAREVCGLLLGSETWIDDILPVANIAADPVTAFEIDAGPHLAALRRARGGGAQVIGHYHSHPCGSPVPSPADAASSHGDGALWLIVGEGGATLWRAAAGGRHLAAFDPLILRPVDVAGLRNRGAAAKVKE